MMPAVLTPSRPTRSAGLAGLALAAVVAAAGCGTDTPADPGASSTPASATGSSTTGTSRPTATPEESGTGSPQDGFSLDEQRSPSWPRLGPRVGTGTAVRVGRHEGYDRVVYEFTGSGEPTFQVRYVDEPVSQGSGEPIDVAGDAFLMVSSSTVEIPEESAEAPLEPGTASLEGTTVMAAPPIFGGFEGYGETVIGVRGQQRPFRVSVLTEPTRLVVDIAR
ncbi:hypothetical protein JQN72_09195 [Phycicoccus sp. CSK15P-2]|uniref:AMIN-like domain-containing (lipo)protein n=1 Tax=Phycicoccus sp. CSK15P-2 TaxID=2807627 RepID=UPI00194EAB7F|nr:hypothetical protein [Phycicoccus sp. CSK15P-2]MBM6404414.1 hypothetical protein [Phycicoccus sp. CSK15P-2]